MKTRPKNLFSDEKQSGFVNGPMGLGHFQQSYSRMFSILICIFALNHLLAFSVLNTDNVSFSFSAYQKFQQFFSSINVCGLRRAPKLYLCRQGMKVFLKYSAVKFDFLGYNQTSCQKFTVRQLEGIMMENHLQLENKLHMLRCPPLKIEYLLRTRPNSIKLFYITSNLWHHSITLFVRDNDVKETPKQELNVIQLEMQPIFEHIHRERFLPEPSKTTQNTGQQKSYQQIEDEINSFHREVRPPSVILRSIKLENFRKLSSDVSGLFQYIQDRWLADHVSISFSKIKNTKSGQ